MGLSIKGSVRGVFDILSLPTRTGSLDKAAFFPIALAGLGRNRSEKITLSQLRAFLQGATDESSPGFVPQVLDDLDDVDLGVPSAGDILVYTGTEWIAAPPVLSGSGFSVTKRLDPTGFNGVTATFVNHLPYEPDLTNEVILIHAGVGPIMRVVVAPTAGEFRLSGTTNRDVTYGIIPNAGDQVYAIFVRA